MKRGKQWGGVGKKKDVQYLASRIQFPEYISCP